MGIRRYRLSYFRKLLKDIGFIEVQSTYFNSISFIPALILASIDYVRGTKNKTIQNHEEVKELKIPNIIINKFFFTLMRIETKIIKLIGNIPIGVTLLCIVQKPL